MNQLAEAAARPQRPTVIGIGDLVVARRPSPTFTTVLGSCIAVGLWDPSTGVGGLNHYLLAHSQGAATADLRYGDASNPALLSRVIEAGANPKRLKAVIVGGANMIRAMLPIGAENADFARDWLRQHRIHVVAEDVGGAHARRLSFTPSEGIYQISKVSDRSSVYS